MKKITSWLILRAQSRMYMLYRYRYRYRYYCWSVYRGEENAELGALVVQRNGVLNKETKKRILGGHSHVYIYCIGIGIDIYELHVYRGKKNH